VTKWAGEIGGDTWEPPDGMWPNGGFGGGSITAPFTKILMGGGATAPPVETRTGGAAGFDISIGGSTIGHYGSAAGLSGSISAGLPHSGCTRSNVLIVKRITAIGTTRYTDIIDNLDSASDNDPNWPTDYLKGKIDSGNVNIRFKTKVKP
jgi:hypothetical protein